ncbi:hypothetical protein AMATHDRAFT_43404 [Amanita thiersii Skay4041]|uniref:Fungal-type protein kinase domain-containing protein n=1 Tax=Amanita thiersii Skay4041 TaxID=703135 RepID=A0A2A9NGB3_9AGAR|nr:hypothetical protein AMATHDRAFT_43404 [Amanita thiersii Skay4041]
MTLKNRKQRLLTDKARIKTCAQDHSQIYFKSINRSLDKFIPGKPDDVEFKLPTSMHAFKQYPHNENIEDITRSICCDASGRHCRCHHQLNRVHSRTTLYPVGVPLVQFPSTTHIVSALRDAIKGRQALFECGLLHRDISPHSILLIESEGLRGFLHDLDHCTYVKEWDKFASDNDDPALNFGQSRIHILENLCDTTGTYQFIAVDVLDQMPHESKHDLESFFWVLMWLVLGHMQCTRPAPSCAIVFDCLDPSQASYLKRGFLSKQVWDNCYVGVSHNGPLSRLLRELTNRVYDVRDTLSHLNFLALFESALRRADWPKNNGAKLFRPGRSI